MILFPSFFLLVAHDYKRIVYRKLQELVKWRFLYGFQTTMATPCCRVFSFFIFRDVFICKHGLDLDLNSIFGPGLTFVNILWWLTRNTTYPVLRLKPLSHHIRWFSRVLCTIYHSLQIGLYTWWLNLSLSNHLLRGSGLRFIHLFTSETILCYTVFSQM